MTIQAAMDFLTGGQPPLDIEEQLITNNRVAGSYASANLYRPIEAGLLRELITILTDGMDELLRCPGGNISLSFDPVL